MLPATLVLGVPSDGNDETAFVTSGFDAAQGGLLWIRRLTSVSKKHSPVLHWQAGRER